MISYVAETLRSPQLTSPSPGLSVPEKNCPFPCDKNASIWGQLHGAQWQATQLTWSKFVWFWGFKYP